MYPCLVPKWALNAVVNVNISNGLNEDGAEDTITLADLQCNLQFKSTQKLTAQKEIVTISGKAMFPGDAFPDVAKIEGGTLEYNGETYDIYAGQKHLNFDGTVNYTELELM